MWISYDDFDIYIDDVFVDNVSGSLSNLDNYSQIVNIQNPTDGFLQEGGTYTFKSITIVLLMSYFTIRSFVQTKQIIQLIKMSLNHTHKVKLIKHLKDELGSNIHTILVG